MIPDDCLRRCRKFGLFQPVDAQNQVSFPAPCIQALKELSVKSHNNQVVYRNPKAAGIALDQFVQGLCFNRDLAAFLCHPRRNGKGNRQYLRLRLRPPYGLIHRRPVDYRIALLIHRHSFCRSYRRCLYRH